MKNLNLILAAGACATLAALVGCESSGTKTAPGNWTVPPADIRGGSGNAKAAPKAEMTSEAKAEAKAEMKSEAKAEAKAETKKQAEAPPAPAPASNSGWSRMALPTGNEATSAILVERSSPSEVVVGQVTEYMIKVTNLTNTTLKSVTVNDQCLENFAIKESSPGGKQAGGVTTWDLGDLGPRESKTITVRGTPLKAGSFTSCADVRWNNLLCATTNVVQPALAITKAMTPESILNCGNITATIEVKNTGSGTASNVHIKDALPAGLTTTDGQSDVDIVVGNLAGGQSATKTINLKAAKTGKFENSASVMADGGLTATSNTVATVVKQPVLAVDCSCGGKVYIGRDGTCTVNVKNTGDASCDDTKLTVTTNGTVTKAEGGVAAANTATFTIGKLNAGETKTFKFNTTPSKGSMNVTVDASATCSCAVAAKSQCSFGVVGTPDIGTSISDDDGVVTIGNPHVYTYTVVNQGQVDLTGVKVVGTLDDGSDYVSTNWAVAPSITGKTITWNVGTVKVGERKTFTVTIKGTTEGEHGIETVTSCDQFKRTVRNDEQVNYIK